MTERDEVGAEKEAWLICSCCGGRIAPSEVRCLWCRNGSCTSDPCTGGPPVRAEMDRKRDPNEHAEVEYGVRYRDDYVGGGLDQRRAHQIAGEVAGRQVIKRVNVVRYGNWEDVDA